MYYISSVYLPSNSNFDARTYYTRTFNTFIYTYRKVLQRTKANLGLIKNIFENWYYNEFLNFVKTNLNCFKKKIVESVKL